MTALPCTNTALTHRQRAHVRAALEEQAAFRRDQIAGLETARQAPVAGNDMSPAHKLITRTIEGAARQALAEVRAAQQRLVDGTYGVCVRCGEALPIEILEVLPAAADCVACRSLAAG